MSSGNPQVAAGGGVDRVILGAGDDTVFQGDGFDLVEGESGKDRLLASGSADAKEFTLQGFDGKARIARDTGAATTDSTGFDTLGVNAAGGQDLIDIGDLSPSSVLAVEADLGLVDGARDQIHVQGTDQFDTIGVRPSDGTVRVEGLQPAIGIENARADEDALTVYGRGGTDFVSAQAVPVALTFDGGPSQDVLDGTDSADTLIGGPGGDVVTGGNGNDTVDLGDGDDLFSRGPADGVDRVEGGAGADTLSATGVAADESIDVQGLPARTRVVYGFTGSAETGGIETVTDFLQINGSGGNDRFEVVPVGSRTRVTRDIENVDLDLGGLERVDLLPGPGRRHRPRGRSQRHVDRSRRRQPDGRPRPDRRRQPVTGTTNQLIGFTFS